MASDSSFREAFHVLTGHPPFPWQVALYDRFLENRPDNMPPSCNLPTGLGKTNVIACWLIALANGAKVPRRLVYVVNRRTVVVQTTVEVERFQKIVPSLKWWFPELAISTLRGQYATTASGAKPPPARPSSAAPWT